MSNLELDSSHVYRLDGVEVPGVSKILDTSGFKVNYPEGDYATRGTAAHKATALIDQGRQVIIGVGLHPYIKA